jgi:hypothetical protein
MWLAVGARDTPLSALDILFDQLTCCATSPRPCFDLVQMSNERPDSCPPARRCGRARGGTRLTQPIVGCGLLDSGLLQPPSRYTKSQAAARLVARPLCSGGLMASRLLMLVGLTGVYLVVRGLESSAVASFNFSETQLSGAARCRLGREPHRRYFQGRMYVSPRLWAVDTWARA